MLNTSKVIRPELTGGTIGRLAVAVLFFFFSVYLCFAASQSRPTECLLFLERSCDRSGGCIVVGRSMSMMTNHYYRGALNRDVGGCCIVVGIFLILAVSLLQCEMSGWQQKSIKLGKYLRSCLVEAEMRVLAALGGSNGAYAKYCQW